MDPDLTRQLGAGLLRIQANPGLHSRARLSGLCHQTKLMTLVDLKAEACQRLVIEQGHTRLAIGLADYGRVTVEIADRIQTSPDRHGLLYTLLPSEMMELRFLSPTAQWHHLSVDRQAVEQTGSTLGITTPDWQALHTRLRADASLLATLLEQLHQSEQRADATEQMILLHLASLLHAPIRQVGPHGTAPQQASPPDRSGQRRSQQLVDLSLTYFAERLDRHIGLPELSDHCATSVRRIQAAFRQCLDKTPLQVLQELRLQQLRRHLLTGLSVGEACQRVGLRLSGHIARAYQKQYGELPRQTLTAISCSVPPMASPEEVA